MCEEGAAACWYLWHGATEFHAQLVMFSMSRTPVNVLYSREVVNRLPMIPRYSEMAFQTYRTAEILSAKQIVLVCDSILFPAVNCCLCHDVKPRYHLRNEQILLDLHDDNSASNQIKIC